VVSGSLALRPAVLEEAVAALASGAPWTILAGGTDLYPARPGHGLDEPLLDVTGISDLRGIIERDDQYRIGALTTWSDVVAHDLPAAFDALRCAAGQIGSIQIQNTGTVGGNLCNASPAADGVPPLLALGARVELTSVAGTREIALDQFLTGYRQTAVRPGELVTAVLIPKELVGGTSRFEKLGSRAYLIISIVMLAVAVETEGDRISGARIAVGACSPVAQRLPALERDLVGLRWSHRAAVADVVAAADLSTLHPIDDIRAPASYRLDAVRTLLTRAIARLHDPALAGSGTAA
jgi:CO/xanthine dehydrogenase FAD-binding subunit